MANSLTVSAHTLRAFLNTVLDPHGLLPAVEQAVVEHLVRANLRGVDSHGLQQIMGYDRSLRSGRINPRPQITIHPRRGAILEVQADGSPGQYAAQVAMETAIAQARETGIALVGITHSNHFGMAGYYVQQAAAAGMIGFATSDTNVVDLAPYGGKSAKLGNNPMAWGLPTGTEIPLVLDMATGAVSGGKIKHFAYQGISIPEGWGLTPEGTVTQDGNEVAVNLAASYKGSGLALIADLLCGPLLGTAAAMFKQKSIPDAANGTGHLLGVVDISAWTDLDRFTARVQAAIAELKATPRLEANQPLYYPGELEGLTEQVRSRSGIPVPVKLVETLADYFGADRVQEFFDAG
ncbi:Ldh family oxidoreductase [Lyngbya confervoides]|uniref:Ldh family oxidoreductase n=1 Tax=Lyngbya confervoides BDU141951 TaxID=1574623 RepID=A0ABD4SZ38_9CYAN|nr:Ldh family oxidoreductase [Lyngbya confervoides]MCM1981633.1 Ldh family oxidoreductase [Lyngbya confervoides BDU141951]